MSARAYERVEDHDERGTYSVLYAEDEQGVIHLDEWPSDGTGDAAVEADFLNAHPDELRKCIAQARSRSGAWAPRGRQSDE
jgi:hypothetical protein